MRRGCMALRFVWLILYLSLTCRCRAATMKMLESAKKHANFRWIRFTGCGIILYCLQDGSSYECRQGFSIKEVNAE